MSRGLLGEIVFSGGFTEGEWRRAGVLGDWSSSHAQGHALRRSLIWGQGAPETLRMATFIFLERPCVVSNKFSEGLMTERAPSKQPSGTVDAWGVWERLWPEGSGSRGHGWGMLVQVGQGSR